MLVHWETWTSNLRLCCAHLKHGKEQLVDGTLGKLVEHSHHIFTNWPMATEVKKEAFETRLAEFATSPTIPLAKWLLQISLKLTKDKMGEVRKDSDRRYRTFVEQACTARGASTGRALVKVMVKDKTIMYQQVGDKEALLSGVTIEERQSTRASNWCFGKWATHSCVEHAGLQEAFDKLTLLLKITPMLPKHKLATIRHALLSSSVYAGQGPDHWVLKHWAYLPDEALRQLALIIFMMEQGAVPAQALLVYIGLIPKPAGGERPIGLTAMLYRLALRLRKALVSEWDDKHAGFWDDAVKGSSPLRAAILRSLRVEVSSLLGLEAVGILWDVSAFFDSILLAILTPLALEQGFNPWLLGMAIRTHMGPRAFKEGIFTLLAIGMSPQA